MERLVATALAVTLVLLFILAALRLYWRYHRGRSGPGGSFRSEDEASNDYDAEEATRRPKIASVVGPLTASTAARNQLLASVYRRRQDDMETPLMHNK